MNEMKRKLLPAKSPLPNFRLDEAAAEYFETHSVTVIASTHSADMLDRKDLPDDSLLAVALQDGETVIGLIDDVGKSILHKHLYTAGELDGGMRLYRV